MAHTRIHLCGRFTAQVDGRRIEDGLPGRQGRLLFAYLVANRLRPAPRSELVGSLWGDDAPASPDAALSALLSKLRKVVQLEGRSDVRVLLPPDAWVDVDAAHEAMHRAEAAAARGDLPSAYSPARVAQHIAARELLPGEHVQWVEELRRRLEGVYLRGLELVAESSLALGGSEIDTAARAARALVERAPFRETGYRLLMQVLDARGNRAEALRVYEGLRILLREELGAAPAEATQDLHRALLA